jgi:putative ABC transport system ATP-binding protein
LLGLIAGLSHPDAGTIAFDTKDVSRLGEGELARLRSTRIGVVLQTGNLVPFLTAKENVELAIQLGGRVGPAGATDILVELGLSGRLHHRPARLSGGETQRVSLAMAFAKQPDLLLADEVTGELDSGTADHVMGLIFERSRSSGVTVLFVTHDRELAERAEHRLRLADGQVSEA